MKILNTEMADILEIHSIDDQDDLESFDAWDSLARLSLLAIVDKEFNVQLSNSEIEHIKTLSDVKLLIETKLK